MQPTSLTVMLWRNISVINKTNISGFTFFIKGFVYSCCLFVETLFLSSDNFQPFTSFTIESTM